MIVFKDEASDHLVAFDRACTMEEELGSAAHFVTPAEFARWKAKKIMWGKKLFATVSEVGARLEQMPRA